MKVKKEGQKKLVDTVKDLQDNPRIRSMVENRIQEFKNVNQMDSEKWHEELVYCLLTAYSSARMGQKCVDALYHNNTISSSLQEITSCLKKEGHRFANKRAEYIYNTLDQAPILKKIIQNFPSSHEAREWIVKNVKGIGWKESSHFLRNVGYFDLAIIDRHIISNMIEFDLFEDKRKSLTKKRYLELEKILEEVAEKADMSLGELDLYLWYRKTGQVLK